jgi:LPS-assembly lipoprotein
MSSADATRRAALLLLGGALAGCGFHPLYGGAATDEFDANLAAIKVTPIAERIGQLVANSLRDSFNPRSARVPTRYVLNVTMTNSVSDLAIRKDGTASREGYSANAAFTLLDGQGGALLSGTARATNSYDVGESEYAVIVANQDAQTRAAAEIAQEIRAQVALYFRRQTARS